MTFNELCLPTIETSVIFMCFSVHRLLNDNDLIKFDLQILIGLFMVQRATELRVLLQEQRQKQGENTGFF